MKITDVVVHEGAASELVGKGLKYAGQGAEAAWNAIKYPFQKQGYSKATDKAVVDQTALLNKSQGQAADLETRLAQLRGEPLNTEKHLPPKDPYDPPHTKKEIARATRAAQAERDAEIAGLTDKIAGKQTVNTEIEKLLPAKVPGTDAAGEVVMQRPPLPTPDAYTKTQKAVRGLGATGVAAGGANHLYHSITDPKELANSKIPKAPGEEVTSSGQTTTAQPAPFKPEVDPSWYNKPETPSAAPVTPAQESTDLKTLLKLSGQRAITERDFRAGITQVQERKTLSESKSINECGPMGGMDMGRPASLNISAGSAGELADLIKLIGGIESKAHSAMAEPMIAMVTGDSMNDEVAMETYDNTPEEKVFPYDPNQFSHIIQKVRKFAHQPDRNTGANPMAVAEDQITENTTIDPLDRIKSQLMNSWLSKKAGQ
jgi:hypothetical protein